MTKRGGLITNPEIKRVVLFSDQLIEAAEFAALATCSCDEAKLQLEHWVNEGAIICLNEQGRNLYPKFQFDPTSRWKPHFVLKETYSLLSKKMGPWQITFWFLQTSKSNPDRAIFHNLSDSPESVLAMADRFSNPSMHG